MSGANNPQQSGSSSAEREQKMLDSSMENLSRRLSDLRNSLTSLIFKIENDRDVWNLKNEDKVEIVYKVFIKFLPGLGIE